MTDTERGETWTAEHLRRCLCRWILAQPKAARDAFHAAWVSRHGKVSAEQLVREVRAEREMSKRRAA